jgi:hypothetical protein
MPQKGASLGSTFSIANTPADPAWHGAITGITVNGSTLPAAAYDKTQSGQIVFNPALSALLQSTGHINIVVSATGYSAAAVVQTITPPSLGGVSVSTTGFKFTFTSTPGLGYTVLGTTNVTLALSQWQSLGHPTEGPTGHYQFTDIRTPDSPAFYYTVRQP